MSVEESDFTPDRREYALQRQIDAVAGQVKELAAEVRYGNKELATALSGLTTVLHERTKHSEDRLEAVTRNHEQSIGTTTTLLGQLSTTIATITVEQKQLRIDHERVTDSLKWISRLAAGALISSLFGIPGAVVVYFLTK